MWNSFMSSTDAAKDRLVSVLEKTGEALHQKATANVRQNNKSEIQQSDTAQASTVETNTYTNNTKTGPFYMNPAAGVGNYIKSLRNNNNEDTDDENLINHRAKEVIDTLKVGWGSVLKVVESTQKVVEKEIASLQAAALLHKGSFRITDTALPLDVQSLLDVELTYITSRIITLAHPFLQSATNGDITPQRKLAAVGHFLDKRHKNRYMVWNLTELEYDTSIMDDQVMTFRFPGMPSPPLGMLVKILLSMESWLKADEQNVIVVHCLTGRGRTCTVVTSLLCWIAEAGFGSSSEKQSANQSDCIRNALEYIAHCKRSSVDLLTIPSQRRYLFNYFGNMLDGIRPSSTKLVLKRVIFSEAPKFASKPLTSDQDLTNTNQQDVPWGCSPYVQVFKGEQLLCTASSTSHSPQGNDTLSFCSSTDGPISFTLDVTLKGDFLLRSRHLTPRGQRISMFRAALCTGYIPSNYMLRLNKDQLDGACSDKRFGDSFFIDLIFETCTDSIAENPMGIRDDDMGNLIGDGDVDSSSKNLNPLYDSMIQKESRFWDLINERRECSKARRDIDGRKGLSGPTIGKRRDFTKEKEPSAQESETVPVKFEVTRKRNDLEAFTIGAGLDVMDSSFLSPLANESVNAIIPKNDDLMDALNAIDDDDIEISSGQDTEEISSHSSTTKDSMENAPKASSNADESVALQTPKEADDIDIDSSSNDEFSIPLSSSQQHPDEDICDFDDDDMAELDDLEQFLKNAHI